MKYSTWLNLWLENYVKPSNKTRTYLRYRQIATNHVEHYLGEQEIDDITPLELQQYVSKLLDCGNIKTGKGLAPNTVNTVISVLQNSLKTAHALGYAKNYAASALKRPRIAEHGVECFSFDEQKKIEFAVQNCKKTKMLGVLLCLYSGLRIGELLALKWSDIDFDKGLLTVSHSCHDCEGKLVFDTPKTDHSHRLIPLPKQILPILKKLKKTENISIQGFGHLSTADSRPWQKSE